MIPLVSPRIVRSAIIAAIACLWTLSNTSFTSLDGGQKQPHEANPADLYAFFEEWRAFERPPTKDGAPDYSAATFAARYEEFLPLKERLEAMDTTGWTIPERVDWHLVRAEMKGFDFNHRILRPWVRDPAYYQSIWMGRSDVPGHEGPTHHAVIEFWMYELPLTEEEDRRLTDELSIIPPLMRQARQNLTGNARELWLAGIRNIRSQRTNVDTIERRVGEGASDELLAVIEESRQATDELIAWLEAEAEQKDGPSGIGKDNYTWYQQNVHLVPLTWEEEVQLLRRELNRAWSSLKLEETRNRNVPPLASASTREEFAEKADRAAAMFMAFLEEKEIMTVEDYMEPALREHLGRFVPEERRNFFQITAHFDPLPLLTHSYHWIELERMELEPHTSPVRQGALLYNIFDSRNEGTATGVEEMFMHAGLYDDSPHSREIVWIMLAQRAARGLGSLYAHANELTMEEAGGIHAEWTPRGWMKTERELMLFEQQLYMRQPGYGTSYVTGKYLLEKALGDYAKLVEARGEAFRMKDFFDRLSAIDSIPISLARWEMTGLGDQVMR